MSQPQSRLSSGSLGDTAGVAPDLDAGATTFTSLPRDLVATQILSRLPDPFDLAQISLVSSEMRKAVKATGRELKKLDAYRAAGRGYLNMLKYMDSRGRLSKTRKVFLCMAAARSGQLEELKALRAEGCPWNEDTCTYAAKGGHLEVLQWAGENDCPWDEQTCAYAAAGGHLEILEWARENRCPWDWQTCALAAARGHFEVLKWAHENGCPWDEETCENAAGNGHLEVLKYARGNGCPWYDDTRALAANLGYVEA